jgi:hypothetical protein
VNHVTYFDRCVSVMFALWIWASDRVDAPGPTVEGPIPYTKGTHGFPFSTVPGLAGLEEFHKLGYTEHEFFFGAGRDHRQSEGYPIGHRRVEWAIMSAILLSPCSITRLHSKVME